MDMHSYEPEIFRLPFPPDFADEPDADVLARANAMCGAAEQIFALALQSGQTITVTDDDRIDSRNAFDTPALIPDIQRTAVALHLSALLNEYDLTVVQSAHQLRNFCTNILIDKAVTGKTEQIQLRAVEMLGKIKDVGLFEIAVGIRVEVMPTEEIKNSLRDKINSMRAKVAAAITAEVKT